MLVGEDGLCFLEGDPMLPFVKSALPSVPLEAELCHDTMYIRCMASSSGWSAQPNGSRFSCGRDAPRRPANRSVYASRAGAQMECIPYLAVAPVSCKRWLDGSISEIFRGEPGVLPDARQHSRANLVIVVKGEHEVRPALARQGPMRTPFTFDDPADTEKRREDSPGLGGRPRHAALKVTLRRVGAASACSRRSAKTRSANAWTWAIASSRSLP
jgi:hypothetical protein